MQFYELIKSRVECHDFRERIELAQVSVSQDIAGKKLHSLFTQRMMSGAVFCLLVVEITIK